MVNCNDVVGELRNVIINIMLTYQQIIKLTGQENLHYTNM